MRKPFAMACAADSDRSMPRKFMSFVLLRALYNRCPGSGAAAVNSWFVKIHGVVGSPSWVCHDLARTRTQTTRSHGEARSSWYMMMNTGIWARRAGSHPTG